MPAARYDDIADGYNWLSPAVRRAVMMSNITSKNYTSAFTIIQNAGLHDSDWLVRFEAVKKLAAYPDVNGFNTLYTMMDDSTGVVSSYAAQCISSTIRSGEQIGLAATKLRNMFYLYGDGSLRADRDYGWYSVGYSLKQCGLTGAGYMNNIRQHKPLRCCRRLHPGRNRCQYSFH